MIDRIGDKYAFLQLIAAEEKGHSKKISQWKNVLSGIRTGELQIGSRTAVSGMPLWATPEIIRGGFATGGYAAGGPLRPHEKELAAELGLKTRSIPIIRTSLNSWHLSSNGVDRLKTLAKEQRFICDHPEEAALMSIALLADEDHALASDIVAEISPYFDRLRFFPRAIDAARPKGIYVRDVSEVREALASVQPREDISVQFDTLNIWIPLYDRLIDLLADSNAQDWKSTAKQWQRDFSNADQSFRSKRWSAPHSPFERCRLALEKRVNKKPLGQKDMKYVQLVVRRHRAKHGMGTARKKKRLEQAKQDVKIWHDAMANIVLHRLKDAHGEYGLIDPAAYLSAPSQSEAGPEAPMNADIPHTIQRKTFAALQGSIGALITGGQISSPEVFAKVLPQITAQVQASGFDDEDKAAVFSECYKAFHKRRSLLLLNLESQIRITEIPWVKTLLVSRKDRPEDSDLSRTALTEFASLTLTHFPHVQFPNPLIEQMHDLAKRAKITTPLLPEIAADIFMGRFSQRFEKAAQHTAKYYEGTLYARYYNLPKQIPNGAFDKLCAERAEPPSRQGWSAAQNGTIIEQGLILTSHNMAALFSGLDLSKLECGELALKCFVWICERLTAVPPSYHAELISLKNSAYAWRQMIALLSELPQKELQDTIEKIFVHLAGTSASFQNRLRPVMNGLYVAGIKSKHLTERSDQFLGWTVGRHPLSQWPDL